MTWKQVRMLKNNVDLIKIQCLNWKGSHKSEKQKITIANLNKVYNTSEDFIQLFNNFPTIAKYYHQNKYCKDYQ